MNLAFPDRMSTGISGLDEILDGGLIPGRAYLIRGGPGTGKTILGLHYLAAGAAAGEPVMYITLGEPEKQIRQNAASSRFNLGGIEFVDLSPAAEFFAETKTYDIFSPAEVEMEPTTKNIVERVEAIRPRRVVLDGMTQFRYLATDIFQYRRQVLSFLRFLEERGATVLYISESSENSPDDDLQFLGDGAIHLNLTPLGRSLTVTKFRGSDFRGGNHSFRLGSSGMQVFPRLLPEAHRREFTLDPMPSGIPELDKMLSGGFMRGTVTFITGPSGVGKTTLGVQFMEEAAEKGERSVIYSFDESIDTIIARCEAINIPVRSMLERGTLALVQVEPLRLTADEFAHLVREEVEERHARIVMIDSVAGYRLSLQGEDLIAHLHAQCKYLRYTGVTGILINEVETISGDFRATEMGISYLADNIVFMRYMERHLDSGTEIRKTIGVLKKRLTDFEKTLREFEIGRNGIKVGEPMPGLSGLLSGVPVWHQPDGRGRE